MDKFDWLMAGVALGALFGAGVCVTLITRHGYVALSMREAARLVDAQHQVESEDRWQNEGGQ